MLRLETKNLILITPSSEDLSSVLDFEARNKEHLKKWESLSSGTEQSLKEEAEKRLKIWITEVEDKKSVRILIRPKANPVRIIGFCNFTQIIYGPFKACYLGYKIDHEYEGKGLMFEALKASIDYVFGTVGLHRVMANYIPGNRRSANLLKRLGFITEGFAKNYLMINNKWEDHVLTALSFEQWEKQLSFPRVSRHEKAFYMREACYSDLQAIIELLFEDELGRTREDHSIASFASYEEAFAKISADPNCELIVGEFEGKVIGVMQVNYLYHLTFKGSQVAHIEGVRIHKDYQNKGFGKQMFEWVIERSKICGCHRIQLMTDKRRQEARKFYEGLGFLATHEGMKLFIT